MHASEICPSMKWWWKLKNPQYNSVWKQIVIAKYSENTNINLMSPIWKEIYKLEKIGSIGCNMKIGDGRDTKFWYDRWFSECALSSSFSHLFNICINKDI